MLLVIEAPDAVEDDAKEMEANGLDFGFDSLLVVSTVFANGFLLVSSVDVDAVPAAVPAAGGIAPAPAPAPAGGGILPVAFFFHLLLTEMIRLDFNA